MPTQKLRKIESLANQIEKLKQEHALLTESLAVEITKLLNKKNALSHDFETLIGGIVSVIDTLKKDDEAALSQKQLWKKNGKSYFELNKKGKAPKEAKAS
jgi:hypothetical protein